MKFVPLYSEFLKISLICPTGVFCVVRSISVCKLREAGREWHELRLAGLLPPLSLLPTQVSLLSVHERTHIEIALFQKSYRYFLFSLFLFMISALQNN